ncbi:MAG: glycosyltransferase [Bacteroidota bacterium]|nr:glycosyltransferase [Bacteroidota bacterium]
MKVAFLTPSNVAGGAERVLTILSNRSSEDGIETYFISFDENSDYYSLNKKVNFIHLGVDSSNKSGLSKYLLFPKYYIRLRRYLKQIRPDVVVSFLFLTNIVGTICCNELSIPIILSERNDPLFYGKKQKNIMKLIYKKSDGFVCQSKNVLKTMMLEYGVKDSVVIPNPITTKQIGVFKNIKSKRIISVGRLIEQKNHKLLIEAFKKVQESYPEYELYIFGEGELRQELEQCITRLELSGKVFMPGLENEVIKKNNDAQLFVLPSKYEGFPNVLIEAMCNGIPSIATDVPSGTVRDLIVDGENGYLFHGKNPNELGELIINALGNIEELNDIGKNGMDIIDVCSEDLVYKKWLKYIQTIKSNK